MIDSKIQYRIYLADTGRREELLNIVECHLDSYTLYSECYGGWQGSRELTIVIEYIGIDSQGTRLCIRELAKQLKEFYKQRWVTVTASPILKEDI